MSLISRIGVMIAPALVALALGGAGAALADGPDGEQTLARPGAGDNGTAVATPPPETPAATPPPQPPCRDGETCPGYGDTDGDGWDDYGELSLGSDPNDAASTPEHAYVGTCVDGLDNDLDGAADGADDGCNIDSDGDGLPDPADNCPYDPNAGQADADGDGQGDDCDYDWDNDGFDDAWEREVGSDPNDPGSTPETGWMPESCSDGADNDLDGATDDADDGCAIDVCIVPTPGPGPEPLPPGPDGGPVVCVFDADGDGFDDFWESSVGSDPFDANSTPEHAWMPESCSDSVDNDLDGLADLADGGCDADVCVVPAPLPPKPGTEPLPPGGGDGLPPIQGCDYDADDDGFDDFWESEVGSDPDNALSTPEHAWMPESCSDGADNDLDGASDMADDGCNFDSDEDAVPDLSDNCPYSPNPAQADADGDGLGDECDFDRDNDFADDKLEELMGSDPGDAASTPEHSRWLESCSDGLDNDRDGATDDADPGCQPDGDGDFVPDASDNCPTAYNPEQADTDGDGDGDACEDSDGDGFFDLDEAALGSDPNDAGSTPEVFWIADACADGRDNDGDGTADAADAGCQDLPVPLPAEPGTGAGEGAAPPRSDTPGADDAGAGSPAATAPQGAGLPAALPHTGGRPDARHAGDGIAALAAGLALTAAGGYVWRRRRA
ncbi:MAG: thrombospondin type 3 repeat-containing protein [Dehalococcoidia bacterium]|nr:thrombospondin type 3 repeat-containing protein [Dehalococcoidia bacterium]